MYKIVNVFSRCLGAGVLLIFLFFIDSFIHLVSLKRNRSKRFETLIRIIGVYIWDKNLYQKVKTWEEE